MSGASQAVDFGFDDVKVIKTAGVEQWKQVKPGQKSRVSIIAFKKFLDVISAQKAKARGSLLSDQEKAELGKTLDQRIADALGKKPEELTEIDRLDIKNPKFSFAWTHFNETVGTIRCLGQYEGNQLKTPGPCCDKFGDADQTVGTVVLEYPVDEHLQVDPDDLLKWKHTNVGIWKMGSKKFKKVEAAYIDARNDQKFCIDLRVTLDSGDVKYQKQEIVAASTAFWSIKEIKETEPGKPGKPMPREIYDRILDQGLRAYKHVQNNLGFEMSREKLLERIGGGTGMSSAGALAAAQAAPVLQPSYDDLIK